MPSRLRLGVNIDHVATIRNARGGDHPDPVRAAHLARQAGADGITAHLREDRRHIRDEDVFRLNAEIGLPLNLEMAATEEMCAIALKVQPHACCIVPERREERTTEGGLDVAGQERSLSRIVGRLSDAGIRVSLFIEAQEAQIQAARRLGSPVIEIHTGAYCEAHGPRQAELLDRIRQGAALADSLGIECHAGHGLDYATVGPIASIANMAELNIGHFLVGEAVFIGLEQAIWRMRAAMDEARGTK